MTIYEPGDRVLIKETGQFGTVIGPGENFLYAVVPDGLQPWAVDYDVTELDGHDGPPYAPEDNAGVHLAPAQPIRPGLPGVGDALLGLAAVLGAQLPDNELVQGKLAELKAAVEAAMPPGEVRDAEGNGWAKCGPLCDLVVLAPGRTQCSGAGGCTR